MVDAIARVRARTVLVGAWAFAMLYAFPGYLNDDAIDQLRQVRAGHYTDWHPPLMAWLWAQVEHVVAGPFGIVAIQLSLFMAGTYALLARRLAPGPAACATAAITLFPPVLIVLAVVWKDALMAGFLLAGAALATTARRRDLALAAGCLFFAAGMRHNAAIAIVPFAIAGAHHHLGPRPRATAAGLAAAIAIAGAAVGVDRALTDERTYPWCKSVALLDLAGTIREAGPMTDDEVRAALAGVPLHPARDLQAWARAEHNHWKWYPAALGDERLFDPIETADQRDAVEAAWWRTVRAHPWAWLEHRAGVFAVAIGLGATTQHAVYHAFQDDDAERALRHDASPSTFQRALIAIFDALGATPLFRPVVYLVLALVLALRARWRRGWGALLASGLLYEAGLFVAAPSTDFRYSHWAIACSLIALAGAAAARVPAWRIASADGSRRADPA